MKRRSFFRSAISAAAAAIGIGAASPVVARRARSTIYRWIPAFPARRWWIPWGNGYVLFRDGPRLTGQFRDGTWWVQSKDTGAMVGDLAWGKEPDGSVGIFNCDFYDQNPTGFSVVTGENLAEGD